MMNFSINLTLLGLLLALLKCYREKGAKRRYVSQGHPKWHTSLKQTLYYSPVSKFLSNRPKRES